jgi:hypothetical protein
MLGSFAVTVLLASGLMMGLGPDAYTQWHEAAGDGARSREAASIV